MSERKDVNINCKCYSEPQSDCPADVHFKQFETDVWSEPELDGLYEVLQSVQSDVALTDKQVATIGRAIIQCYRPTDKKRQFFLDWYYAQYPKEKPDDSSASGWQPIETAPKDHSFILLCDASDGEIYFGRWMQDNWDVGFDTTPDFTHWMQLPTPPEVTE